MVLAEEALRRRLLPPVTVTSSTGLSSYKPIPKQKPRDGDLQIVTSNAVKCRRMSLIAVETEIRKQTSFSHRCSASWSSNIVLKRRRNLRQTQTKRYGCERLLLSPAFVFCGSALGIRPSDYWRLWRWLLFFRFRALSRRLDSATTIGVEFLVKTMLVENLEIKFQLWDTGNEGVVLCRESPQR